MNLDEAIETLIEYRHDHHSLSTDRFGKAILLSVEALKRVKTGRPAPPSLAFLPLPGETED
ncbi:hypothetical protein ES703_56200 [subsurface metagenome]